MNRKVKVPPDFNRTLFKEEIRDILEHKKSKRNRTVQDESTGYDAGWIDCINFVLSNIDKTYLKEENELPINPNRR